MGKKKEDKEVILLKPKPTCPDCLGRGWLAFVIIGSEDRDIRPCHCVKARMKGRPASDSVAYQQVAEV
ncbi:hypothetical protein LCGC14_0922670 [marine sediment metagenome]|uniref:Uncharacterized protein n=1 Tax=marine sediment metagenome TaxID=412755 RepID=A0A0F9PB13_9ZZZZ